MGCSQSKIENEEAVSRCKERKAFMKSAVTARNAFAAAHVSYAMSLKNAGAALTDFAQGEVSSSSSSSHHALPVGPTTVPPSVTPPQPPLPMGNLPPPPPPVPDMPPPLQRAVSMPEFAVSKPGPKPAAEATIDEEDEDEDEDEEEDEEEEEEDVGRLRRRRENKGGSVGGRIETTATSVPTNVVGPPPSPPPPEERERTPPLPPMPEMQDRTWDYFFNTDDIPGGSLRDVEEMENSTTAAAATTTTTVYHQRAMRSSGAQPSVTMTASPSIEVVEEMVMPEKPPMPPGRVLKKGKQVVGQGGGSSGGDGRWKNANLVKIFSELDDCFLKASESAHHVSKMLEATRLHYHSNFADNRGKSFFCFHKESIFALLLL